jgi:hypothetical protein
MHCVPFQRSGLAIAIFLAGLLAPNIAFAASIEASRSQDGPAVVFIQGPLVLNDIEDFRDTIFGGSKAKAQLDEATIAARAERLGAKAPELVPWRFHDIRRTVATRLGDLGVQPHIIEAVLNRVSRHKAGVAGICNQATYAAEKAAALSLWANHLRSLVGGELR